MELLKRNKILFSAIIVVLLISIGSLLFAQMKANEQSKQFDKSGYVILANEQAESKKYAFNNGTKYEKKLLGGFEFKDVQKNEVELNKENFVYFDDKSYTSLAEGVLLNLEDVGSGQSINHYSLTPGMELSKSSKGYQIQNKTEPVDVKEALWKISDDKFLLLSNEINVHFDEKDIRSAGQYLEINYIDKGVIQLVTDDNIWQTVSTTAYVQTEDGGQIALFDQVIKVKEKQMVMSKLVINNDANIELSPLETKKQAVPDIDIKGEDGISGESGTGGKEGTSGSDGTSGDLGEDGTHGDLGEDGIHGDSGENGTSGNHGDNGADGNKGSVGGTGSSGSSPGNESSSKTGLPQISITDWKVSAIGMSGTYKVDDENVMLTENLSISVYEEGSGKKIDCVDSNGMSDNFNYVEGGIFRINSDLTPLKPDTEYRFIISGKYEMSGQPFEREFVSRVFYTDSLGVFMEKNSVTTKNIKIDVLKKEYSKATTAEIYLLTSEQAKNFNPTNSSSAYIMETVDFAGGTEKSLEFSKEKHDVKPDTNYIVRMVLNLEGGEKHLTQQSLNFFTLKQKPKISSEPYAIANRQLGAFELFGGQVIDPDNAIISYIYEIYNMETNESVKSMEVKPSAANQATILYVDNEAIQYGTKYAFKVITVYNDNEKIVELESVFSPEFSLTTANLPAVRFEASKTQYNRIEGNIIIDLNGSTIEMNENNPLDIAIECEGVFSKTLSFKSLNDPDVTSTQSQVIIKINENHLSADKIYRFTVTGKVDLGDIVSRRVIGSVVKQTPSLTKLKAVWGVNQASGNAISRTLKLEGETNSAWDKDSYDASTLSKVVVELYRGSGTGKVYMSSKEFTDDIEDPYQSSLVDDFVTNGIEITENTFGYPSSALTAQTYTIRVGIVQDYTATVTSSEYKNTGNFSNYMNEYNVLESSREEQVSKATQPPTLPDWQALNNQVNVDPIYNKDAGVYNQPVSKDLADDTIVGYKLKANYDNYAKLSRKVTYYAFESRAFDNMVSAKENPIYDFNNGKPIGDNDDPKWLVKKEIPSSALNIPTMAIFFENKNNVEEYDFNGNYIRFAGDVVTDKNGAETTISEGMTRGYKYTFAYTISYSPTGGIDGGDTLLYPYEHPSYNKLYNNSNIPNAYVLNSGTINAPKTNPTFEAFPWKNQKGTTMEVRYKYKDVDKTIPDGSVALIDVGNGYIPLQDSQISSEQAAWNTLNFTQLPIASGGILDAKVKRELYNMNYGEENLFSMFKIALDNDGTFARGAAQRDIDFSINQSLLSNNILQIKLKSGSSSSSQFEAYKDRITSLGVTIESTEDPNLKNRFIVPYNATDDTAMLSTSKLFKLLNKKVKVSVAVYYDTGEIGWAKDANEQFAFQHVTTTNNKVALGKYLAYNQASGSLDNQVDAGGSLFKVVQENGEDIWVDEEFTSPNISMQTAYTGSNARRNYTVKPTIYGISQDYKDVENYLNVFTPKKTVSELLNSSSDGSNIFTLNVIAPSVTTNSSYSSSLNSITLRDVDFNGIETIEPVDSKRKVHVELTDSNGKVQTKEVVVDSWNGPKHYTITGLEKEETYQIRMFAYVNGNKVILLNGNAVDGAFWSMTVNMKGTVKINRFVASYKPINYQNKEIILNYELDQTSGFFIEFDIYDMEGNVIYTAEQLKEDNIFKGYIPGQAFQNYMTTSFVLPVGNKKLIAGSSYVIKIKAYSLEADNTVSDEEIGAAETKFAIPIAKDPIPFVSMVSRYNESTKKIALDIDYSMADLDRIIMTDYKNGKNTSAYLVRLNKVNKEGVNEDVTPDDIKNTVYEAGKNYKITVDDVDPNTVYSIKIYSSIDSNLDGIEDRTGLENSIDALTEEELSTNLEKLLVWEETVTTPGENGIGFGDVSLESAENDITKISVAYKNASNLNTIVAIDYSILSSDGTIRLTGQIDNKDKDKFRLKKVGEEIVGGYYLLDLPEMLEINGLYRVVVNYYLKDNNGQLVPMSEKHTSQYAFYK